MDNHSILAVTLRAAICTPSARNPARPAWTPVGAPTLPEFRPPGNRARIRSPLPARVGPLATPPRPERRERDPAIRAAEPSRWCNCTARRPWQDRSAPAQPMSRIGKTWRGRTPRSRSRCNASPGAFPKSRRRSGEGIFHLQKQARQLASPDRGRLKGEIGTKSKSAPKPCQTMRRVTSGHSIPRVWWCCPLMARNVALRREPVEPRAHGAVINIPVGTSCSGDQITE